MLPVLISGPYLLWVCTLSGWGIAVFLFPILIVHLLIQNLWWDFFYFHLHPVVIALGLLYGLAFLSNCAMYEPPGQPDLRSQLPQQSGQYSPVPQGKQRPVPPTLVPQQANQSSAAVLPPLQIDQRNLVTPASQRPVPPTWVPQESPLREALSAREEALADAQTSAAQARARAKLLEADLGAARTEMAALRAEQARLGVALAEAKTEIALFTPAHTNADINLLGVRLLDLTKPGTIFALFAATVTVLGFTITITRLQESHVRISSYEELLERIARLLQVTLESPDDPDDRKGLRILCTVPNLGNMSHPGLSLRQVYPRLKEVGKRGNLHIDIVCIDASPPKGIDWDQIKPADYKGQPCYDQEDFDSDTNKNILRRSILNNPESSIGNFYRETFKKQRHFEDAELLKGMLEAIDIFVYFNNLSSERDIELTTYRWAPAEDTDKNNEERITIPAQRAEPHERQPPVHLFWTRKRAIVSVPLDRSVSKSRGDGQGVTMVGYETTDKGVIENLLVVYEEWKRAIRNRPNSPSTTSRPVA